MKKLLLLVALVFSSIYSINTVYGFEEQINQIDVFGVEQDGEYTEDIVITFDSGTATIDGLLIESGYVCNKIGYHTLIIEENGVEEVNLTFTILPRINIEQNESYLNEVTINLENEGTMTQGYHPLENMTTFNEIGKYSILITGSNDFEMVYDFTVDSALLEYASDHPYYGELTINIDDFAAVYINHIKQTENITYKEMGIYTIKVLGKNSYLKTYDLTVGLTQSNIRDGGVYDSGLIIDGGNSTKWKIGTTTKDPDFDTEYLTTIGNHTVIFYGNNDYTVEYSITITEGNIGLFNGKEYYESFYMEFTGYKVHLNDVKYLTKTTKEGAGYYTVTISGVNGYTNEYDIFIDAATPFEDTNKITESVTLDQAYDKIYVNGQEVEDYHFFETGVYRVVFEGEGDYIKGYTIEYINQHTFVSEYVTYGVFGFAGFTVILYGFLGWRRFK